MTAAMAFFSIALTMNLTGVHLQDLRASDLKPSSLKRDFTSANASVVRYYEGLRVVYELESRVHDLESAAGHRRLPQTTGTPSAPAEWQSRPQRPSPGERSRRPRPSLAAASPAAASLRASKLAPNQAPAAAKNSGKTAACCLRSDGEREYWAMSHLHV